MIHASDQYALEGDQDNQAVAENVVVKGAEELRGEEWGKPALAEKFSARAMMSGGVMIPMNDANTCCRPTSAALLCGNRSSRA